jgi:hypothetical protein
LDGSKSACQSPPSFADDTAVVAAANADRQTLAASSTKTMATCGVAKALIVVAVAPRKASTDEEWTFIVCFVFGFLDMQRESIFFLLGGNPRILWYDVVVQGTNIIF